MCDAVKLFMFCGETVRHEPIVNIGTNANAERRNLLKICLKCIDYAFEHVELCEL